MAREARGGVTRNGTSHGVAEVQHAMDMLRIIARNGCRHYTSGSCNEHGRVLGAYYSAEAWCDSCVANDALEPLVKCGLWQ